MDMNFKNDEKHMLKCIEKKSFFGKFTFYEFLPIISAEK